MIPLDAYVRDTFHARPPSLSASLAHTLLTCSARHAWYDHPRLNPAWQPEATEGTDLGTVAHALLLEGSTERVVVVDADDWRTKAARQARDTARADGKLPILSARMADVTAMVTAAREALASSELAGLLGPSDRVEETLLWEEQAVGVWCRARPDVLALDRGLVVDYKTTAGSAEPEAWARSAIPGFGYDLQAAFILRGLDALDLADSERVTVVFLVQETTPPYAVSFVALSPEYRDWSERKRAHAVALWADCLSHDRWPGYPDRIAYVDPPPWAMAQWEGRPDAVDDGRPIAEQLTGEETP